MIYVLLPVYNEENNVDFLIERISGFFEKEKRGYRIIAVNDGSRDRSAQKLSAAKDKFPLEIIAFELNRGVGAVFKAGLEYAVRISRDDEDILISLDCDRTHPPEFFAPLIAALEDGAQAAIASRYHPQSRATGLPLFRALLSNGINLMLAVCLRVRGVRDYTTFFRAYRVGILRKAFARFGTDFIRRPGFSCMAEILARLKELGVSFSEVPVHLCFEARKGKSKMKIWRTIGEYLGLLAAESAHSCARLFSKSR